jgi:hypothetical protein
MTTAARIWLATVMLGAALAVQTGLLVHMVFGPDNTYPAMLKSFSELPSSLREKVPEETALTWSFVAHPAEKEIRPRLPFVPADLVYRYCKCEQRNVDAVCYIVHSEDGEDRKHHPEICIRDVQGVPEDKSGRENLRLGEDRPVQRFSFKRSPSEAVTVYYWHYTFAPEPREGQSRLQLLYQTFSRNPPSVTVQVSTTAGREHWPMIEKTLLAPLEQQLREHLPATIKMGCDRLPIAMAVK